MAFFVYVLANPQGKSYVGQTADLERRLAQHNDPTCELMPLLEKLNALVQASETYVCLISRTTSLKLRSQDRPTYRTCPVNALVGSWQYNSGDFVSRKG